ncbi:bacteriophage abortive infection AbiH family protein [Pseudomonas alliivorans]|uniref:bacteriophage abortive infection AbiH family protein n=1 Tax=Pseudomonas alliivorans TaxID=2810613 RepID=UPI001AE44711|nr:bacteriophage abortive infection AbiH family protein [Pseudomonas alliivorans]MBP0941020.1 bacteriophage abortive infection AbiH family protein [Pseudomonas alliivorans]MEE4879991.1 bacteriophage abortive infection AbiH family protein [Pseudomonas alliivorans]MEE4930861.1 bacteriophage abortive infection AbiH family protein [Pseudomonas alliivorans]MEE4936135.1 bacteriophage abortive infection AbiH family protein [Pseudomonas alliivorans]MEE4940713.1 bacteriophage abortive infection AbiH fa
MLPKMLYIIGNGFDLNHGLPTGYRHFKAYVRDHDREVYDWVEEYVPAGESWADLEMAFAELDTDHIVSSLEHFMGSYSDDDWSDSGHHDFQYEVDRVAGGLGGTLQKLFAEWVSTIQIPDAQNAQNRLAGLDINATYLTFNYTSTLTRVYLVPAENILHIHGESTDADSELVLGHGWSPEERTSLFDAVNHEDSDHRLIEAMQSLDDYFSNTFKPYNDIIERNSDFFCRHGRGWSGGGAWALAQSRGCPLPVSRSASVGAQAGAVDSRHPTG